MAKLGKLIHKYTIKGGVIVPLIYEDRFVEQNVDEENIDLWFKQTTKMNRYGDEDTYEEAIKNQFCTGDTDILIVCSKLLTGFDAPISARYSI